MLEDINDIDRIKKRIIKEDHSIRLWNFTVPGLERKKRDFDFKSGNFSISVIDPFNGILNPWLISYETLIEGYLPRIVPTVILDSNVISNLHLFVAKPELLNNDQRKVIINLLDYLILDKVDYNPAFYFMESFAKTEIQDSEKYITSFAKSLLTLYTMDEYHFLTKREIRVDYDKLEVYGSRYNGINLDEMSFNLVEGLKRMHPPSTDWHVLYVILLKAALIHKTHNGHFVSKINKLYEFVYDTFGVLFSRELSISVYYFSGKIDGFIPFQKGANFEKAINRFRASAWDIYLLRFPELLLSSSIEPIPLAAICTGDYFAQYIGRKFKIRRLLTNNNDFYPELEFDYSDVNTSPSQENVVNDLFKEYRDNRFDRRRNYNIDEVLNDLPNIINKLENELKELCA